MNRIRLTIDASEVKRNLEKLGHANPENIILKTLDSELNDVADIWLQDSSQAIAEFSDTGELLGSGDIKSEFLHKEVSYNAPHAIYLEMGTSPHMPPVEPLIKWAKRKLGVKDPEATGWAIAMKIKKEGTEPKNFFTPAVDRGVAYFKKRLLELGFKVG